MVYSMVLGDLGNGRKYHFRFRCRHPILNQSVWKDVVNDNELVSPGDDNILSFKLLPIDLAETELYTNAKLTTDANVPMKQRKFLDILVNDSDEQRKSNGTVFSIPELPSVEAVKSINKQMSQIGDMLRSTSRNFGSSVLKKLRNRNSTD